MAVCGYAVGASNPSGGINIMGAFWMTPTVLPLWIEVVKAVAPLLAALLAAGVGAWVAHKFGRIQEGIARQQAATAAAAAQTAKNKLKLELFDRRIAVYDAARKAIDSTGLMNYQREEVQDAYKEGIDPAVWLFENDVLEYLNDELWPLLFKFGLASRDADTLTVHDERASAIREERDLRMELAAQSHRINEVFARYLRLES
jgi:hypothetical protein